MPAPTINNPKAPAVNSRSFPEPVVGKESMGPDGVTVTKTPGVVVIKVAMGVNGRSVPVGVLVGVLVIVTVTDAVAVNDGIGVFVAGSAVCEGNGVLDGSGVSVGGAKGVAVKVKVGPGVGVARGGCGVLLGAGVAVARTSTFGKTTMVTAPSFTVI